MAHGGEGPDRLLASYFSLVFNFLTKPSGLRLTVRLNIGNAQRASGLRWGHAHPLRLLTMVLSPYGCQERSRFDSDVASTTTERSTGTGTGTGV